MTDPRMNQRNKELRPPSIRQMFFVEGAYNIIGTTVAAPIGRCSKIRKIKNCWRLQDYLKG